MNTTTGALLLSLGLLLQAAPPAKPLADRTRCRQTVSVKPWAKGLKQIPSTVIDKGVLRAVPYTSYRAGEYELNVYGDPASPACFEIGIHGALLSNAQAKKNCVDIILAILTDPAGEAVVKSLKPEGDLKTVAGITYEITPPTAEDAYGGWWVSVYSEALLDKARASEAELAKITTTRKAVASTGAAKAGDGPVVEGASSGRWAAEDLADARKADKNTPEEKQAVYLPAVTKKDGAYVPDRTIDDTGYILFICANSDKHEDMEVILKVCSKCQKEETFFWDADQKCFISFKCGAVYDNAKVKCGTCGKVPRKVRTKHL
jgi:hypothetical protein